MYHEKSKYWRIDVLIASNHEPTLVILGFANAIQFVVISRRVDVLVILCIFIVTFNRPAGHDRGRAGTRCGC